MHVPQFDTDIFVADDKEAEKARKREAKIAAGEQAIINIATQAA